MLDSGLDALPPFNVSSQQDEGVCTTLHCYQDVSQRIEAREKGYNRGESESTLTCRLLYLAQSHQHYFTPSRCMVHQGIFRQAAVIHFTGSRIHSQAAGFIPQAAGSTHKNAEHWSVSAQASISVARCAVDPSYAGSVGARSFSRHQISQHSSISGADG